MKRYFLILIIVTLSGTIFAQTSIKHALDSIVYVKNNKTHVQIYDYNDLGLNTSYTKYTVRNGSRTPESRVLYEYDQSNNLIAFTNFFWDYVALDYYGSMKRTYAFDLDGNKTEETRYEYDTDDQLWDSIYSQTFIYNSFGNVIEENRIEKDDSDEWNRVYNYLYTYDDSQKCIEELHTSDKIYSDKNKNRGFNQNKKIHFWNNDDFLDSTQYYHRSSLEDEFEICKKELFRQGDENDIICEVFTILNDEWVISVRRFDYYDEFGNQVDGWSNYYWDGVWSTGAYRVIREYTDQNLITFYKTLRWDEDNNRWNNSNQFLTPRDEFGNYALNEYYEEVNETTYEFRLTRFYEYDINTLVPRNKMLIPWERLTTAPLFSMCTAERKYVNRSDNTTFLDTEHFYYYSEKEVIDGLQEITSNPVKIYPNPSDGFIWIDVHETIDKNSNVRIFDISGNLVLQKSEISGYIEVSSLNPGLYLIELEDGQTTYTQKLIVR